MVEILAYRPFFQEQEVFLGEIEDLNDFSDAFITKKEEADLQLSLQLRKQGIITTPGQPFKASQKQEIEALIAKDVFEFVQYNPTVYKGRIFNSKLVNEVKGKATELPYEKSRLVIQAYNNEGKEIILT